LEWAWSQSVIVVRDAVVTAAARHSPLSFK
jgi:hypothetical protein